MMLRSLCPKQGTLSFWGGTQLYPIPVLFEFGGGAHLSLELRPSRNGARIRRIVDQPEYWQRERPPYNSCPIVGQVRRTATRRQRLSVRASSEQLLASGFGFVPDPEGGPSARRRSGR
jgi:hypothetical protein